MKKIILIGGAAVLAVGIAISWVVASKDMKKKEAEIDKMVEEAKAEINKTSKIGLE